MHTLMRLGFWIGISVLMGLFMHRLAPHFGFDNIPALISSILIVCACAAMIIDLSRGRRIRGAEMTLLIPFCLAVAACTTLGLASPQSFDEQLAEAYGVHTAVVSATATALTSGAITAQEARAAESQENGARAMLDAARAIESTNAGGAASDLQLASAALSAIQAYLNTVKPGGAPAPAAPGQP